jgi:HD-GYP domain-containing protein (c-di-GMP phosphodiesterase class II)
MPRRRTTPPRRPSSRLPAVGPISEDLYHYGGRAHVVPETVMKVLATVADTADARAGNDGHAWRVASYVAELVRLLGLEAHQSALIADAARLHDMGAVDLSSALLTKPGPLSEQEWALIRTHVTCGAQRLAALLETVPLSNLVLHHHERVDGAGYPDRISGKAIPLGARVIAVADSFDAMTHAHVYQPADFITQSMATLEGGSGTAWDPDIVRAFVTEGVPHLMRMGALMVSLDGRFDHSWGRV